MTKTKSKIEVLKARGIRFSKEQWSKLKAEAKASKVFGSPSEIVRDMTDRRYARKKK